MSIARLAMTAAVLCASLVLAACGGDDSDGGTTSLPAVSTASTPETTDEPTTTDDGGNGGGGEEEPAEDLPISRNAPLDEGQREQARLTLRAMAQCLRANDVAVATEQDAAQSVVLKRGNGVLLRLDFAGTGADVYIGGTGKATQRAERSLDGVKVVRNGTVLVAFDGKAPKGARELAATCAQQALDRS